MQGEVTGWAPVRFWRGEEAASRRLCFLGAEEHGRAAMTSAGRLCWLELEDKRSGPSLGPKGKLGYLIGGLPKKLGAENRKRKIK
jgi:hypothetical protein